MQVRNSSSKIRSNKDSQSGALPLLVGSVDAGLTVNKICGAGCESRPHLEVTERLISENKDLKCEACRECHPIKSKAHFVESLAGMERMSSPFLEPRARNSDKLTVGNYAHADCLGSQEPQRGGSSPLLRHSREDRNLMIEGILKNEVLHAFVPSHGMAVVKTILMLAVLMGLAVLQSQAARHPALEPNADSAKCITCHADKTSAKSAHAKGSVNCLSCHEVRVNKDITRVKLITPTPAALCFTCHKDKNPTNITGLIHAPDARDCLKCHDPHKSDNSALLLKPMSGDQTQNLCLTCHDIGVHVAKGGSRHPALDSGCDTCHIIHKTGDPHQREFAYHMTKDAPALCMDCHDLKDPKLVKAHHGQPFETADCIQCHDPRTSDSPHLMQTFQHNPFKSEECDDCHAPAKNGKVVLTQKDVKSTCGMCHEEQAKQIANAKVKHPGAQEDCTVCHNPHAGQSPGFLQPGPVSACLTCHPERTEDFKKKHVHQPASDLGCATCHEPHGGDNAHLLRKAKVNELCLECHGPDASPQKVEGQPLVTIFDGKVKLPANYFSKVPVLPLKYGLGHPTENHPVSDSIIPKSKTLFPMNCLTCHQPHAGMEAGMLVKDQKNDMNFCQTCHKNGLDLTDVQVGGK
jgi:predicted CXXCH cytochrome family protein